MAEHERFHYRSLDELVARLHELGLELPVSRDLQLLGESLDLGGRTVPNRLAVHPMEGCDCEPDGGPGELTRRRYLRFAGGGAGLIWMEACAMVPQGRGNPRQMMLTDRNAGEWARLLEEMRAEARRSISPSHRPLSILQLHHAGRYSRPEGSPRPLLAHHCPTLDADMGLSPDHPLIADHELDRLQEDYLRTARLAGRAGFDGVDVKACHGYLPGGLLAAFTREGSRYGGPEFEGRTRFVREVNALIAAELPGLLTGCRLGLYDAIPYPCGWGVGREDPDEPDLREPIQLAGRLAADGLACVNVTVGNPYHHPHYNRPFDSSCAEEPPPPCHPLQDVARLVELAGRLQRARPDLAVVGTGYSYLRRFAPCFAAGAVREGMAALVGFGRGALAYPDFARDILQEGGLDRDRACITCSGCTQLMRDGMQVGCIVRDRDVYGPLYRRGRRRAGGGT